jgi:uncharacterized membrane protein YcaP (DUF421 family)
LSDKVDTPDPDFSVIVVTKGGDFDHVVSLSARFLDKLGEKGWDGVDILSAGWRSVVAFLLALAATRVLNKQFVARLTYFDFTLGVMLGALMGHIPNDFDVPFWPVMLPLVIVTAMGVGVGWLAMRYEPIRHLIQGEPTVLIQNGHLLDENMRRLRYNLDQLNSQLRVSDVWDISQVEFAVLEPGGQLSVQLKSQYRPVTPSDLRLTTRYEGMAVEVVMDGQVIHKNLQENGLTEQWLERQLQARGMPKASHVYYAVLNTRGELFVDRYDDAIQRPVDIEGRHPSTPPSPSV